MQLFKTVLCSVGCLQAHHADADCVCYDTCSVGNTEQTSGQDNRHHLGEIELQGLTHSKKGLGVTSLNELNGGWEQASGRKRAGEWEVGSGTRLRKLRGGAQKGWSGQIRLKQRIEAREMQRVGALGYHLPGLQFLFRQGLAESGKGLKTSFAMA